LSQRFILGIGLSILLLIIAASIAIETKSRRDLLTHEQTVTVLRDFNELKADLATAESAARGFVLKGDAGFIDDFRRARAATGPRLDMLLAGSPATSRQAMEETRRLVERHLSLGEELIRLGNSDPAAAAGLISQARALLQTITADLDRLRAEHRVLLQQQSESSRLAGRVLLAVDIFGGALILLLAAVLIRASGRWRRELTDSLLASRATAQSLEAAVAERTRNLSTAHDELQRSTSVLQSTFNGMAEAVLVIDTGGHVVLSNPAAEKMLRYRPGMDVAQLRSQTTSICRADGITALPPEEMPAARALRGDEYDGMEFVARGATGKPVHIVASGRPLRDSGGAMNGAVLVFRNTTAAHDTERKLQQAQKLEAIGKLTGGVAHDFNNMLTVITGTTESLVAGLQDQPSLRATATLIDQAAQRCTELIEHLLAFARRQPLHPRNVDVNAAISDVAKLLRPTLGEQIEIETDLDPDVATAHLDASQLANSILNMAINARDAMPKGGRLTLQTRMVTHAESGLDSPATAGPPRYVMIAVTDTGTGMPAHVREKVFEPFFTTKEVGKGSGLGLSMVYGFVTQSGGHIRIDSEEGAGTTIRLYLPPSSGEAAKAAGQAAPPAGGSETILVVEDDALVRNFVTAQLAALGYNAVAAADGPSALVHLKNGEHFDLLFADVVMPGGMSGRQLADEAEKIRPGLKVLYTSGYSDDTIMHQGRLDPGLLLLQKPYRKGDLARMIRQALGR
jgi:PAS domain S-box-containing protein